MHWRRWNALRSFPAPASFLPSVPPPAAQFLTSLPAGLTFEGIGGSRSFTARSGRATNGIDSSAVIVKFATGISRMRNEGIMTNRKRVLALIRFEPGLTDSDIRKRTSIEPHQQVNRICRTFAVQGLIERRVGPDGLLINIPADVAVWRGPRSAMRQAPAARDSAHDGQQSRVSPVDKGRLPQLEFSETLFVVPCSGGKASRGTIARTNGVSVLDFLPSLLADELRRQRGTNACEAKINESSLLPAYKRYTGNLYEAAGNAFDTLMSAGAEVLIISGGYGVVHAREPVGRYNRRFCNADWSNSLISRCLAAYAAASGSKFVIGLFSKSGDYAKAFCKAHWPEEVERVCLIRPKWRPGTVPRETVPRATGQALAAIARGEHLNSDWESSDCLPVSVTNLLP